VTIRCDMVYPVVGLTLFAEFVQLYVVEDASKTRTFQPEDTYIGYKLFCDKAASLKCAADYVTSLCKHPKNF